MPLVIAQNPRAELPDQHRERLAVVGGRLQLEQRQLALDMIAVGHVDDVHDIDELAQLL